MSKINYTNGVNDGLALTYHTYNKQLQFFVYWDNGRELFALVWDEARQLKSINIPPAERNSTFVDYDEDTRTIRHGYWLNGEKAGVWRTWNTDGVLPEEISYVPQP